MTTWQPGPAWLFVPADRPDRFAKALERSDIAVIDLEDAVAADRKAQARAALAAYDWPEPERTLVRLNPASTAEHALDLDLLAESAAAGRGPTRVMLAKAEAPTDLDGLGAHEVVVILETPAGVVHAREIIERPHVVGAMWGAEDLIAGLGGTASRDADGRYRPVALHAQNSVLLASKAAGKLAIDTVHLDIPDHDGLARESRDSVAIGFDAKASIHPGHIPIVRAAFAPDEAALARAHRILAGVAEHGEGVFALDGAMVDGPIIAQAHRILARAAAAR